MNTFEKLPPKKPQAPESEKRGPHELTRREALAQAVAMGAVLGANALLPDAESEPRKAGERSKTEIILERGDTPHEYEMGPLAGRRVADLFAFYFGVPEGTTLPERLEIDFQEVLDALWEKKIEFVERREPEWLNNTRMARRVFSERYAARAAERRESVTLHGLVERTQETIEDINGRLDWEQLNEDGETFAGLTERDASLVKKLAKQITGEMLTAFSITELMPSVADSEMNVDVYTFLLENAGPEFLQGIPAIHDPYLSVGLFQFTSYAVFDTGSEQRGASIINRFLPEDMRIPGSVVRLDGLDAQLKAAHLFAIENIARLVQGMRMDGERGARRIETLRDHAGDLDVGLLQYIASAHHNPVQARKAFREWIDNEFRGSHASLAVPVIEQYIRKSHGNYYALSRVLEG